MEIIEILKELETFRKKHEHKNEPSDWTIRVCQAIVAQAGWYTGRMAWIELLQTKTEQEASQS